jgi:hypothetical protein
MMTLPGLEYHIYRYFRTTDPKREEGSEAVRKLSFSIQYITSNYLLWYC